MAEPSQFIVSGSNYGVVWGVGLTMSGSGVPTGNIQGMDWSREPGINDTFKNPDTGATELVVVGDIVRKLEITVIPGSTTKLLAKVANIAPAIFTEVTIVAAGDQTGTGTTPDTDVAGKYRVLSASKTGSPTAPRSIKMSLIRYESDLTAVS